jgi:hypothetical protein
MGARIEDDCLIGHRESVALVGRKVTQRIDTEPVRVAA